MEDSQAILRQQYEGLHSKRDSGNFESPFLQVFLLLSALQQP